MKKVILTFAVSVSMIANIMAQEIPTAKQVIDKYVTVLGGKEKLESVKTLSMKSTISMMGMEIQGKTIKKGNKFKTSESVMGQDMVQLFNGEKGYISQMGNKVEFPAEEISRLKAGKIMDALSLEAEKIKSVEKKQLDGKDYYLLSTDASKSYFDVNSGLLYKAEMVKGNHKSTFKKYVDIQGIKFVEEIELEAKGQKADIKNFDIKINDPISDDEFKL